MPKVEGKKGERKSSMSFAEFKEQMDEVKAERERQSERFLWIARAVRTGAMTKFEQYAHASSQDIETAVKEHMVRRESMHSPRRSLFCICFYHHTPPSDLQEKDGPPTGISPSCKQEQPSCIRPFPLCLLALARLF